MARGQSRAGQAAHRVRRSKTQAGLHQQRRGGSTGASMGSTKGSSGDSYGGSTGDSTVTVLGQDCWQHWGQYR